MKKFLLLLVVVMMFAGCAVNTSTNIKFNHRDIKYFKDHRTGMVFAVVATRTSGSTDAGGIGMAVVPEEYHDVVEKYLEN